jgi:hypothetical protein
VYIGTPSFLQSTQAKSVFVPEGDPGEQLVAYLILSIITCQIYSVESARPYLNGARRLALSLAEHGLIYRPPGPSKFARLTYECEGRMEDLLLPIIRDVLVAPESIDPQVAIAELTVQPALSLVKVEIIRFMLRLRPRKLINTLKCIDAVLSAEDLADALRRIVDSCLRQQVTATDALERAVDGFTLARSLVGRRNFALAVLALHNGDRELDSFMENTRMIAACRAAGWPAARS